MENVNMEEWNIKLYFVSYFVWLGNCISNGKFGTSIDRV